MVTRILLILLGVLLLGQSAAAVSAQERYRAAMHQLMAHSNEFDFDHSPAALVALDALWDAFEEQTLRYLDRHPHAQASALETAAAEAGQTTNVISLQPGLYVVGSESKWNANVFLVSQRSGKAAILWDIRQAASDPRLKGFTALLDWSSRRCSAEQKSREGCGPQFIAVTTGTLPPDRHGWPRFYVDAGYRGHGDTAVHQFAIWQWDGQMAIPLLFTDHVLQDDDPVRVGRDELFLREKRQFQTIGAYGGSDGREMERRFTMTQDAITEVDALPMKPELDVVDGIFARLASGKSTSAQADKAAVAVLRPLVEHAEHYGPGKIDVGFLGDSAVRRDNKGTKLCLVLEPSNSMPLRLELQLRPNHFIETAALALGNDCRGFAAGAP